MVGVRMKGGDEGLNIGRALAELERRSNRREASNRARTVQLTVSLPSGAV
jgi:hypothetical protein